MYPIVQVPDDANDLQEPLGTKPKFWFDSRSTLFKEARVGSGEHWAEKVCCEIARGLALPHAEYDLAVWRGKKGVVTPTFVPKDGRLILGNEVLGGTVKGYGQTMQYRERQHTVRRVMASLGTAKVNLPLGYAAPEQVRRAADLFVGYLMLDALVANQDHHDENWGFILTADQLVAFTPTFDHASSLGRNEQDSERTRRLITTDRGSTVEAYVRKARSALFLSPSAARPLTTLAAFNEAAKIAPGAATYWLGRLEQLSTEAVVSILSEVPDAEMSQPAREFATRILQLNRERLLRRDVE